jgi:DNA sulfur modification protein DndD
MRIKKITFKDFRQFHGEQEIHFSHDTRKNVTLVFGTNGAGKTTILNAIQWVLYGEFSKDFEEPGRLVNDGVMAAIGDGPVISTYVEMQFEHAKKDYTLRRVADIKTEQSIQKIIGSSLSLNVTDEFGANHLVTKAEELISTVFPQRLAEFYFFNGERLESNASKGFTRLAEEIKIVMGLVKYERALKHLPQAKQILTSELAGLKDDSENKLGDRLTKVSKKREEAEEEHKVQEGERERLAERLEEIQMSLRNHDRSRDLQAQRDTYKEQVRSAKLRRDEARRDRKKLINQRSAVAFLGEMAELTIANSEDLRVRGELPRAIKVQFIDDLLDAGSCICGTPLAEGSHEHSNVSEWRLKAGHAESEEAWIKSAAYAQAAPDALDGFIDTLRDVSDRIKNAQSDEELGEANLDRIAALLRQIDTDEVQQLEQEFAVATSQHETAMRLSVLAQLKEEGLSAEIAKIEEEIKVSSSNDQQAQLINRRIAAIDGAISILTKELKIRTELVRSHLEAGIAETYNDIINHEYAPHMDDKFSLALKKTVGGVDLKAVKSTAETHALYLTFIAQLSKQNGYLNRGNDAGGNAMQEQFPIVMDAAFGNFDTETKRRLVKALPNLAHQIIILVSKDQGKGVVEDEFEDRCGKKVVLNLNVVKSNLNEEEIIINNRRFSYVAQSDSYDYSMITEVN